MAAVGRIRQFGEAVGAGGGVRGDQGAGRTATAGGEDGERLLPGGGQLLVVDGLHSGQRRRLDGQPVAEAGHGRDAALHLGDDALRRVGHMPDQGQFGGEAVDVRPEAHALHHAPDEYAPPVRRVRLGPRDVVIASAQVARTTLQLRRQPVNAVIKVDLATRSDFILTVVAEMVSLVPGSLVVEARRSTFTLFLHVLDARDQAGVDKMRREVHALERRVIAAFGDRSHQPSPSTGTVDGTGSSGKAPP